MKELLVINHVDTKYLKDFSITVYEGEDLVILGNNYNEIDSLISLFDLYHTDKGFSIISSKTVLVSTLTISENLLLLKSRSSSPYINRSGFNRQAEVILKRLNLDIDIHKPVTDLNLLESISLQLTKAYINNNSTVVFKNLSNFLSDSDYHMLDTILSRFRDLGLTFIYMDSIYSEYLNGEPRVVVIKDGRNFWEFRAGMFSEDIYSRIYRERSHLLLTTDLEITVGGESYITLNKTQYNKKRGVILGLVDTSGHLLPAVIEGITGDKQMILPDVAIIPEFPLETALFNNLTGLENLIFPLSHRLDFLWQKRRYKKSILKSYEIFFPEDDLLSPINNFSRGGIISLTYLRWHLYRPKTLIIIKPFSGMDREILNSINRLMLLLIKRGIEIVILTTNIWELERLGTQLPIDIQKLHP